MRREPEVGPLAPLRAALARVRELFTRRRLAAELDDEMRFHLEMEIAHNVRRGMTPEDARRAAHLAFGGVQRFREETLDARGVERLDSLARDARLAVRRLRRAPAFTAGVVLTLAIGLGAAGGVGALVYGVLLRPLPYPEPRRLVRVDLHAPGLGSDETHHSPGTFAFFRERARSFAALEAYVVNQGIAITDGDVPERVSGALVTPGILPMLGVRPAAGRLLLDEDARGTDGPVLISHDLWRRRYGGDTGIVGRAIELNRRARLIVGVLPSGFDFPSPDVSIYYPQSVEPRSAGLDGRWLTVVGRLRPGVEASDAEREVVALVPSLPEAYTDLTAEAVREARIGASVQTLREAIVAPARAELVLLGALVGVVLLLVAANAGTLFLLRAERLRGEVAIARALGASGWRVAQRFVVEGVVVALLGAAGALPLAALAAASRFGLSEREIPRLHEVGPTPVLAGAIALVAVALGAALGLGAAARTAGGPTAGSLRDIGRATPSRRWRRAQEGLVAVQLALALALVLGAALAGRSLLRLRAIDLGFDTRGAATLSVSLPFRAYPTYQHAEAFHRRVLDSLRATPGVTAAAAGTRMPLTLLFSGSHPRLEATGDDGRTRIATAEPSLATPDFFRVMRIPLVAGRTFAAGDLAAAEPGVVLGAALARELFGAGIPVGRGVRIVGGRAYRVVGVAGDVYGDVIADGPLRALYFPLLDDLAGRADTARVPIVASSIHYVVRSDLPLATLAPALRRAVAANDSRVPSWGLQTLARVAAVATARARLTMLLLLVAAGAALLIGGVGLYAVIAYAAAGRAAEFAVRLALGASPGGIGRLVMRQGAAVAAVGLAAGLALAWAGTRVMRGLLYETSATDPATYAAAALLVLGVMALASWVPARRAGREDPARALRGP